MIGATGVGDATCLVGVVGVAIVDASAQLPASKSCQGRQLHTTDFGIEVPNIAMTLPFVGLLRTCCRYDLSWAKDAWFPR